MNDPFFNEDHLSIREMARDFAEKTLASIAAEVDKSEHFPEEVARQMADLGFFGLKIPEEYGGLGVVNLNQNSVMEGEGGDRGTGRLIISSANSLSTAPIVLSGSPEQKEQYLPGVVSGETYIAFGLTAPNAGSDAASLTTKAEPDGEGYLLNGRKCFITFAPLAKYAVIYAKTSPEKGAKGITAFLVDMSLPGVSCGKHEEKMGQRGVPVSDILLEDVHVDKSCVLGEVDLGFINAMKTLSVGRVGVAAMCLGIAQEAIDLAVSHTKDRVQFGKPLCRNQAIAFMLADMETKLNAARGLVYNAAWLMDNGQPADKAASMAKYFAAETAIEIVNKSLQLHGGYGYSQEYEIERLYRDVRITSIYEGSSQIQQIIISGQMLK